MFYMSYIKLTEIIVMEVLCFMLEKVYNQNVCLLNYKLQKIYLLSLEWITENGQYLVQESQWEWY